MNKLHYTIGILMMLLSPLLQACSSESGTPEPSEETTKNENKATEEQPKEAAKPNTENQIKAIDALRAGIETQVADMEFYEMNTDELRPKVAQKWSKIHFYSTDGTVVRIKTYPHAEISERTEEFYFDDGQLVLAVVEDRGSTQRGKAKDDIDKMFYFNNGQLLLGFHKNETNTTPPREDQALELLNEAKEYLKLYQNR